MNGPRASNPSTSTAAAPAKKGGDSAAAKGQSSSGGKSQYQQDTERDNPEPAAAQGAKGSVVLSNCQFLTPTEKLLLNEEFEMSVSVKAPADAKNRLATFDLFCTRTRNGKEERTRMWARQNGKIAKEEGESVEVQAKGNLVTPVDYVAGETVKFQVEANHDQATGPEPSKLVEVALKTQASWVGGDDLFFRTDGELPLLKEDGSLIQVLVAAIERVAKPPQKDPETVICFGYASSSGQASPNRKLSLRRAQVVKAILDRDASAWDGLAKANFETIDIQQFLSDLHKACGWECDPGAVDGKGGPKTKAAIESFQRECNGRYKLGLKEDGVAGPKTWGAVLRVIHGQVQSALGQDPSKEPSWAKPKWGHDGKGVYANGEDFATGGDKPEERSVQITFFAQGSEPKLVDKTDAAATKTDNPVHDETKVVRQKVTKGAGAPKGAQEPIEDGVPFYNTTTDELFILPKDKVKDFDREWKMMEMVMPIVGSHFFPDSSTDPNDAHLALMSTFLFMKKLQETTSIDAAEKLAKNAKNEIEAGKAAVKQNPKLADRLEVKGASMEAGWYQKVLYTDGKRMVWVRGEKIRSHARWFSRKATQEHFRREMEAEGAEKKKDHTSSKPATSGELKLFERDFFEAKKGTWLPAVENFFAEHGMQEMLKDSRHFQAGVAAQALRWAAEGKYGANINWTKDKTIKAEAKVEGSFSLLSAQGHFDIYLTGKNGVDLIGLVKKIEPTLIRADAKPIGIQAILTFTGSAFSGVCGSASAGLGLAFKEGKKKEAGMEVGVEAFVGAKVGAEASMVLKMNLFDEKKPEPDWKDLSNVTYGAWAAIGIGVEASFKVGYFDERFRVIARLGVVVKGGAGHYLKGSIHAENAAKLIWTIGHSLNWDKMHKILDTPVWRFYQMIMLHSAITGQALAASANLVSKEIDKLMLSATGAAVAGLQTVKGVDDTFDRYVPGYTIAKKFHPTFLITREAYNLLKQYNQGLERGSAAINTVGKIKSWGYVTRELKHNMLVDLCQTGSGWLGPFSGEDKEDAIIKIMSTIRDKAEYDWINKGLTDQKVNLDDHVDFSQQSKLDGVRAKFR